VVESVAIPVWAISAFSILVLSLIAALSWFVQREITRLSERQDMTEKRIGDLETLVVEKVDKLGNDFLSRIDTAMGSINERYEKALTRVHERLDGLFKDWSQDRVKIAETYVQKLEFENHRHKKDEQPS